MSIAQTILRLLLVVVCSVSGYILALYLPSYLPSLQTWGIWIKLVGALTGFIFALLEGPKLQVAPLKNRCHDLDGRTLAVNRFISGANLFNP